MKRTFKIFQIDSDSYPIRIEITGNTKDLHVGDTILCRACGTWFVHDGSAPFHCDPCGEEWKSGALRLAESLNPIQPEKLARELKSIHD